ncbi:uncharacterized protein LOC133328197 [Musca vetustissima]|uniref:uncharacterized protein LOC133328197 n=1 Tax=Musca vetustissima TaxID=27455 RepID=UPI002AB65E9F|nr:uncharacterized protein LOC133328197 [Musca vetustissima]
MLLRTQQRQQPNTFALTSLLSTFLAALVIIPSAPVACYVINPNSLTEVRQKSLNSPASPHSPLTSKVIFESPSVENIFKDFIVSTKPLTLRKYSTRPKTKKTKKDSRIYYIPIPPMPYRFIPGIGYDYQPMKIKPLLVEPTSAVVEIPVTTTDYPSYGNYGGSSAMQNPYKNYHQQLQNSYLQASQQQQKPQYFDTSSKLPTFVDTTKPPAKPTTTSPSSVKAESKVFRLDRNDYYFNGRPFRLQVAHAGPKYNLTPQNLKSSFYFNKNIIY